jgi:hypothetical protein
VSVAVAGLLSACGSDDGTAAGGAGSTGTTADTLALSTFEGEATTLDGETFDVASLGRQDLVIWFWAPW